MQFQETTKLVRSGWCYSPLYFGKSCVFWCSRHSWVRKVFNSWLRGSDWLDQLDERGLGGAGADSGCCEKRNWKGARVV